MDKDINNNSEFGFRDASSGQSVHSLKKCLLIALWGVVRALLFRPTPKRLYFWRRWLLRLFGADLTDKVYIDPSVRIEYPWNLKMSDHSSIGREAWIYNLAHIEIGEFATISARVTLCAGSHDYTRKSTPLVTKPIKVGNGSWVASSAFVLPGINIGDNAVIGACSVVTRDMPKEMICAGNPCKPIKWRLDGVELQNAD